MGIIIHTPIFQIVELVKIYSRFLPSFFELVSDVGQISFHNILLPVKKPLLLGAVHFGSKMYLSENDQALRCTILAQQIREAETRVGHSRTLLIGDFNMNPFEVGMVAANGLHAIMDREIAKKESRMIQGNKYEYFYNPLWNYFGDMTPGPVATYYKDKSTEVNYYWHIFDQVLVRPMLINELSYDTLKIITNVGFYFSTYKFWCAKWKSWIGSFAYIISTHVLEQKGGEL